MTKKELKRKPHLVRERSQKAKAVRQSAAPDFDLGENPHFNKYYGNHDPIVPIESIVHAPEIPLEERVRKMKLRESAQSLIDGDDSSSASLLRADVNFANFLPQNTDERTDVVEAPFAYNFEMNETVELNTGALSYHVTDFTLPGVNGMDLVVDRRYNSNMASEKAFTFETNATTAHYYYVYPTVNPNQIVEVGGPYVDSRTLNDERMDAMDRWGTANFSHGYEHVRNFYNYTTALRDNNQYLLEHKLGWGWRFNFPSIETLPDSFGTKRTGILYRDYLHLGDGRVYKIKGNALEDHTLEDFTFQNRSGSITLPNGSSASYNYVVTFKDGKEYYLDKKNIVKMADRFGNAIHFQFTANGITIWDSLNRITTLAKYNITNNMNYYLRWTLPDGRNMAYAVQNGELKAVLDFEGRQTTFFYSEQSLSARLFFEYSQDPGATTVAHLLYAISHPTGAATRYSWGRLREQVGSYYDGGNRYRDTYLVVKREDQEVIDNAYIETRNQLTYNYEVAAEMQRKASNDMHKEYTFVYYLELAYVTDPNRALITTHEFNKDNLRIRETTQANGRTVSNKTFEYNSNDLPTKETDVITSNSGSRTVIQQWTYDSKGNVTRTVNPLGFTVDMEYYTSNYSILKSKSYLRESGLQITEQNELVAAGNNIGAKKVLENGVLKQHAGFTYNANGTVASQIEYQPGGAALRTTSLVYQDGIFVKQATIGGLPQELREYDITGKEIRVVDPEGNATTYLRDKLGRVLRKTNPDGSTMEYEYVIDTGWNECITYITNELGDESYVSYTQLGREDYVADLQSMKMLAGKYYDPAYRLTDEFTVGADGYSKAWITYVYDYADRIYTKETEDSNGNLMAAEGYSYDDAYQGQYAYALKQVVGDTTYAPSIITTEYRDALGRMVMRGNVLNNLQYLDTITYDNLGNQRILLTAHDSSRGLAYTQKLEYDFAGRMVREYQAKTATGPEVYAETVYDALGNKVRTIDFMGNVSEMEYDILSRLVQQRSEMQAGAQTRMKMEYDRASNMVLQSILCSKPGETEVWKRTKYLYDNRGRVTDTIVYEDNGDTNYTRSRVVYDARGNKLEVYSGMTGESTTGAAKTTYRYDHFGNTTRITDAMNRAESYTFDAVGTLVSKTDRNGAITRYVLDDLGRITSETVTNGGIVTARANHSYSFTGATIQDRTDNLSQIFYYDTMGRLIREVESGGATKVHTYDLTSANRTGLTVTNGGTALVSMGYGYDQMNRMITVTKGGVLLATYAYDNNGNRVSLTRGSSGGVTTYSYNNLNLITSLVNKNSAGAVLSQFDYTYYLDSNQASKAGMGITTQYVYDRIGRLVEESVSDGTALRYEYDKRSNRTKLIAVGNDAYSVTYQYDMTNRLISDSKTVGAVTDNTTYSYDANGNQISCITTGGVASTTEMGYNGFNQMVSVIKNGVSASYVYRPDGLRHQKTVGSSTTVHIWDGVSLIADTGSNSALYLRGIGLVARESGGAQEFYLFNAYGDVVQMTNASGTASRSYDYDAFGVERGQDSADINPFRFCGEYYDAETDTIYLRTRYYKPTLGRFLAEDIIQSGFNWYLYCGGDPINFTDPFGLDHFIYYGDDQQDAAWGYYNQLKEMDSTIPIHMIYVGTPDAFYESWAAMGTIGTGTIDVVIVNLHGSPEKLEAANQQQIHVGQLQSKTFDYLLLFSCNTGHLDYVGKNIASQFVEGNNIKLVLAPDGTHYRMTEYDQRGNATGIYHNASIGDHTFAYWVEQAGEEPRPGLGLIAYGYGPGRGGQPELSTLQTNFAFTPAHIQNRVTRDREGVSTTHYNIREYKLKNILEGLGTMYERWYKM